MRMDNVEMFNHTMAICNDGYYVKDGKRVDLKLTNEQMKMAVVYMPEDIECMSVNKNAHKVISLGRLGVSCVNADAFTRARELAKSDDNKVLVLNLANAVHPGGGVKRGARAQEEDLCRKSSLMLSLESEEAKGYYAYNKSLRTYLGSDAIILNPNVEIIKDEKGDLLDESVVVSVVTCAAPNLNNGDEVLSHADYENLMYKRIKGIFKVAAKGGYRKLVLGAFGCGAFNNDPKVVSDIFYKVMKEFGVEAYFDRIDFAVLDHSAAQRNFNEFSRNFNNFYKEEEDKEIQRGLEKIKSKEKNLDKIRGSLIGGAVGDALGYAIEFDNEEEIFSRYGKEGITEYDLVDGKALISDDTQMTLFTGNGLLVGSTRLAMRGIGSEPRWYVKDAYKDWLLTQDSTYEEVHAHERYSKLGGRSWLLDVKELYDWRAPGNTCLSALRHDEKVKDHFKEPVNNSKGCGGVMRVAPIALLYDTDICKLDKEAAYLAALTHGHPLGYMPAAVVAHIINRIVYGPKKPLKEIVIEAKATIMEVFKGFDYLDDLVQIIDLAIELSENEDSDLNNIHQLGEGWVAEETLGVALYCALKYQDDFSKAIIAAVNHKGDSDSTGAVTGNIVGALVGYEKIEDKWKKDLELKDVIVEMADDLCHDCQMSEFGEYEDPAWESKYIYMKRYEKRS